MTSVIDAHHHLWDPQALTYGLLASDGPLAALARPARAAEFDAVARQHAVTGAIAVEATSAGADPVAETDWLLEQVARSAVTKAVVAWAPLEDPSIAAYLDDLRARATRAGVTVVGVRRSFEAEPAGSICRPSLFRGVREAAARGLVVDLVLFGDRLAEVVTLVERIDQARFVLDHLAKPSMDDASLQAWRDDIARLARQRHVTAKVSGLASVVRTDDWEPLLAPLVAYAATSFGWRRLMFASDWPICDIAGGYGRWLAFLRRMSQDASAGEQADFFGGTASRVYGIS